MTAGRRVARWFERALLGTVMTVIAFIIERRVLKAIRGAGAEPLRLPAALAGVAKTARLPVARIDFQFRGGRQVPVIPISE